ncbi:hypothetical protein BJV78DRAFT_691808 [Lactifluus subvellereus]|nr:hypothetical protein BJV78DRAFT_691808 [Lactifluus subvellereus]
MVDWKNPTTLIHEYGAWDKLIHVVDGVYLWEFITNLSFEWSLLQGRRQWRWTASFYIACRVATFAEVLTTFIGFDTTSEIHCRIWSQTVAFFVYAVGTFSLSLYAIRSIAVWQRSLVITTLSVAIILSNVGAWVRRVIEARSKWNPTLGLCVRSHTHTALLNNTLLLATEVVFLLLMVVGICYRNPGSRAFKIMYREGLLWLVTAIIVQTVPSVFLILNLNDVLNVMFVTPSVICTSIGATRMYRTLSDRQAGNMLDFWETSRDETTGEIRFRRQTQFIKATEGQGADAACSTALPMGRLVRTQTQAEERFVERFEAHDIELDDDCDSAKDTKPCVAADEDCDSTKDAKPCVATDDELVTEWVAHAK